MTFPVGLPAKIDNPVSPAKYDFNNSVPLNAFAPKAAKKRSDRGAL